MGAVYKGYQAALGRYVAIKVLPPQTAGDPAFADRFAQEARAIGKLRHPNIVTAFDFTQQDDIAFLVSDYIDGGTLADQLGSPLPLEYAMGVLGPIAGALDYAHARGVVHRDIKPQNVLLTREGTPVLTDFGLAKIFGPGSGMTQAGSLMGTADYMAPELAGGAESAGPAADQYALGIIAYQMLVGRHPFPSDNPLSALMAHVNKPVPLPSQLGAASPLLSPSGLVNGVARVEPPPPAEPILVAPTVAGGAATAVIAPPEARGGFPWRRAIVPAILVLVLALLALRGGIDRNAAADRTNTPQRTAQTTLAPTTAPTVAPSTAATVAPTTTPTIAPTARPTITPTVADTEPNNTPATATLIAAGVHDGAISPAGDVDFFRVQVPDNTAMLVTLHADTLPGGGVSIFNASGAEVAPEVNTGADRVARVEYVVRDPGAYFIRVRAVRVDATGTYQLNYSTTAR